MLQKRADIKRVLALGILLLFAVSATPWQWLHTFIFPHAHAHLHEGPTDTKAHFAKTTVHCHCTHDFHPTPCIISNEVATVVYRASFQQRQAAQWVSHFYSIPRYFFSLHGPPVYSLA
ncbi:hypothetical protein HNQ91_000124 [Filimonas zeae]|uniref:hypothetical protein n=1 Tax=Filimonas zeae TaxID=1737353 RepID=UPI00166DCB00|nr:hypothetical protein [Filimonas zeae]MDR6337102.1 hypothetical protein [Filimonas zeae]